MCERDNKEEETYYSCCMFGFDVVGRLLLRLFEALLGHFHPEERRKIKIILDTSNNWDAGPSGS